MSDAKKRVLDKIKKKQAQNKAYKTKTAKRMGAYGIVVEFIKAMEVIVQESTTPLEFETSLIRESNLMHDRFLSIDPEVDLQIHWNDEFKVEKWQDLQVEGVSIKWSRIWRKKNPLDFQEKYLDVAQLFLEGYFDEEDD